MKVSNRLAAWTLSVFVLFQTSAPAASSQACRQLSVPFNNSGSVASDGQGNLYAVSVPAAEKPQILSAFRVRPSEYQAKSFDHLQSDGIARYSGLAADKHGNAYLAVDLGAERPSYLKKFNSNLEPDRSFGTAGFIQHGPVRFAGLTIAENRLIAGIEGGRLAFYDLETGEAAGATFHPANPAPRSFIDLAYIPQTQEVLATDGSILYIFTNGSLGKPTDYELRELRRLPEPASGLGYDPSTDQILISMPRRKRVQAIHRLTGQETTLAVLANNQAPGDATVCQATGTVYVSDRHSPRITQCVAVRAAGQQVASIQTQSAHQPGGGAPERIGGGSLVTQPEFEPAINSIAESSNAKIQWMDGDVRRALSRGVSERKRVVALFTDPANEMARQVEAEIFERPGILERYPNTIWVMVNMQREQDDVLRYRVYRAPTFLFFNSTAQEVERISGKLTEKDFAEAYIGEYRASASTAAHAPEHASSPSIASPAGL